MVGALVSFHFYDRPSEFHGLYDSDGETPAPAPCSTCGYRGGCDCEEEATKAIPVTSMAELVNGGGR